jgi:hypothetical protein
MHGSLRAAVLVALVVAPAGALRADGLAGSPSSMVHQHEIAVLEDYSFLRTPRDVQKLTIAGALVPVTENENLTLSKVGYPFARPEVRDFVERFAASYREATGTPLVVTSLTRPESAQPSNAHKLSVHPAGMAVDLRVPADAAARAFLEQSLLAMEKAGALDVTRERSPAHYHIAVFAEAYAPFAARQDSVAAVERARAAEAARAARVAQTVVAPPPRADASALPALLFGLVALVGMAAPVMFRASRTTMSGGTANG